MLWHAQPSSASRHRLTGNAPSAWRPHRCLRRATQVRASADTSTLQQTKQSLRRELQHLDRGIFGVQAAKRATIHGLIETLESQNPLAQPTAHLERVAGDWRLLYTTITITGVKRTKLGLRDFVKLGDFIQHIDTTAAQAVNRVAFSVAGIGSIKGALTIEASYQPVSGQRVAIAFQRSTLEPAQLQALFEANYDLLLSVFNPDGWLDITFVDDELRVGRDDKGNIFLLERC